MYLTPALIVFAALMLVVGVFQINRHIQYQRCEYYLDMRTDRGIAYKLHVFQVYEMSSADPHVQLVSLESMMGVIVKRTEAWPRDKFYRDILPTERTLSKTRKLIDARTIKAEAEYRRYLKEEVEAVAVTSDEIMAYERQRIVAEAAKRAEDKRQQEEYERHHGI